MSYASRPSPAFGYYRGMPMAGGSGSNMGPKNQGAGVFAPGQGGTNGGWHPTVLYLFGLIIVEMVVFHLIGRILK